MSVVTWQTYLIQIRRSVDYSASYLYPSFLTLSQLFYQRLRDCAHSNAKENKILHMRKTRHSRGHIRLRNVFNLYLNKIKVLIISLCEYDKYIIKKTTMEMYYYIIRNIMFGFWRLNRSIGWNICKLWIFVFTLLSYLIMRFMVSF